MAAAMSAAAQTEAKTAAKRNVTPEERIERQVKRMQSELMLSDDASSKFESLYKDYLSDLRKEADKVAELRKEINKKRADNTLKEKDIKNLQEKQLTLEKKRVEIREKYYDKFSKILNAHQLQKVMFQSFEKRNGRGGKGIAKQSCEGCQQDVKIRDSKVRADRFGMPRVQHDRNGAKLVRRAKITDGQTIEKAQQSVRSDE